VRLPGSEPGPGGEYRLGDRAVHRAMAGPRSVTKTGPQPCATCRCQSWLHPRPRRIRRARSRSGPGQSGTPCSESETKTTPTENSLESLSKLLAVFVTVTGRLSPCSGYLDCPGSASGILEVALRPGRRGRVRGKHARVLRVESCRADHMRLREIGVMQVSVGQVAHVKVAATQVDPGLVANSFLASTGHPPQDRDRRLNVWHAVAHRPPLLAPGHGQLCRHVRRALAFNGAGRKRDTEHRVRWGGDLA